MRPTGYRKLFRPRVSRPIVATPTPVQANMSSLPGLATAAYKTYKTARKNPTYGAYIRRAESYLASKVRNKIAGLSRKAVLLPRMKFSTASATPGEISYSSFTRGKYRPAYFKSAIKTSQKYTYDECNSAKTSFGIGTQGIDDILILRGKEMFEVAKRAESVFGGGVTPVVHSDNYTVWFGTVKTTIRFSNPGLSTVSVDVYNYDTRRDINDSTISGPTSLAQTWAYGAQYERVLTGYSANNLGASPLDVTLSSQYWKILKKTTIQLPPGSEHVHVVTTHVNRKYSTIFDINVFGSEINASHTGYTHGILIVPSGAVVYDSINLSNIDTSGGGLNYVYNTRYEVFTHSGSQSTVEYVDNTAVVTTPKLVVVQNPTEITP